VFDGFICTKIMQHIRKNYTFIIILGDVCELFLYTCSRSYVNIQGKQKRNKNWLIVSKKKSNF